MANNPDQETLRNLADFLMQFKTLNELSSFGAGGMPQNYAAQKGGIFQVPVGGPGQPLGPVGMPQGAIFGGGSPVPIDFGPARLQNTLVAVRDLINASEQFRQSDLGKQLGTKLNSWLGVK